MTTDTNKNIGSALVRHLRTRMVSGLLVLIPLAVTLFVLKLFFSALASFARPVVRSAVNELPEYVLTVIAFLVTVLLVYLVGLVANYFIGIRLIHWGEALLLKLPIVKSVYSASKHAVDTFSSPAGTAFKCVALVDFPCKGSLAVGFITGSIRSPEGQTLYSVFVSTAPNPTAGFVLFLPEDRVYLTDWSIEDGVKMIMSVGILSPPVYRIRAPSAIKSTVEPATL